MWSLLFVITISVLFHRDDYMYNYYWDAYIHG